MHRRVSTRRSVFLCLMLALSLAGAAGARDTAAPQDDTSAVAPRSAADLAGYEAPASTRVLTDEDPIRPLLQAVRDAATALGPREWGKSRSQELGLSTFERFDPRLFPADRLQRVTDGFREGYSQTFIALPTAVFVTAVEMSDPEAAREFFNLQREVLQMALDVQSQREDTAIDVTFEDDIVVVGVERGFEKRYEFTLEEQSPTRFRVLWGQAGRFAFEITFLQSDVETDVARAVLRTLAGRVAAL